MGIVTSEELNQMLRRIQEGSPDYFNWLALFLDPLIDRIIRRMGIYPNWPTFPFTYEELVQEAYWVMWFQIIPRFQEGKGEFKAYASVYLFRELQKRIIRQKLKSNPNIPLEERVFSFIREKPLDFRLVLSEISMHAHTWPREERALWRLLSQSQEPLSLRQIAGVMGMPPTTVWRLRKKLIERVRKFL